MTVVPVYKEGDDTDSKKNRRKAILTGLPRGNLNQIYHSSHRLQLQKRHLHDTIGTLSINTKRTTTTLRNRGTGLRVSFSAGKTKFKQCSFPDRRRLFLCEEVCLICYSLVMAFKDLRNLHLISYDDGLIDGGKFIVLYDL